MEEPDYQALVEFSSDWIWEVDAHGLFVYANQRVYDLLGYHPAEVIGKTPCEFMDGVEAKRVREVFFDHLSRKEPLEKRININRHRDGHDVIVETSGVPILDQSGNLTGYRGYTRDITDEVRTQVHSKELSHLLELSINEIYLIDRESMLFSYANQGAIDSVGYSMQELLSMTPRDIVISSSQPFEESLRLLTDKEAEQISAIGIHKRKDGTTYPAEALIQLVEYKGKEHFLTITIDITKREKAAKELKEKEHMLFQQSKMAAIGTMLENISHQWRQPLGMISLEATNTIFEIDLGNSDDEKVKQHSSNIIAQVKYLSDTINDFRDYFNPNKEKQYFEIKELIQRTLKLMQSIFKHRTIEVVYDLEEISVYGFENELIQILMNLLNNAKDVLEHKAERPRLLMIGCAAESGNARISVTDNGGGIDEKILPKIFEPYFTTKHQTQGTGLGLYMSEEIVTKHMHGFLKAENVTFDYDGVQHTGARFTISLPLDNFSNTL